MKLFPSVGWLVGSNTHRRTHKLTLLIRGSPQSVHLFILPFLLSFFPSFFILFLSFLPFFPSFFLSPHPTNNNIHPYPTTFPFLPFSSFSFPFLPFISLHASFDILHPYYYLLFSSSNFYLFPFSLATPFYYFFLIDGSQ